jgi:predicted phage terminase large subunit-like protein
MEPQTTWTFDQSVVFDNPKLTEEMKIKERQKIGALNAMQLSLEENLGFGQVIPSNHEAALVQLSGSTDPNTQLQMIEEVVDKVTKAYHEKLREVAKHDLAAYCEYMNPEEFPAFHHRFFCTKLMQAARKQTRRLMINCPPGHAKSTYCSRMFPSWYLGNNSKHKIIGAGHTQNFVENEFGKKIRSILENPRYTDIFPNVRLASDSKAAGYWSTTTGGSYVARGIGTGIAGFRANIAILDDPYATREDAESEAIRKKVADWFKADLTTRLLPGAPLFVIGTRWHPLDLFSDIIDDSNDPDYKGVRYEIINLPATAEENDPLGRALNQALWPDFFTYEMLMEIKADIKTRDWNSLYRGQPIDDDAGMIESSKLGRYTKLPENSKDEGGSIVERRVKRVTISVDTASKDKEKNDPTCITVWIEDVNNLHYLKHVVLKRVKFPELCRLINATAREHGATSILVEDAGAGTQYIQQWAGKAPAPIIPITTKNKDKEFRFDSVLPMIEAHEVLFPERAAWLTDYETELLTFPAVRHDDQVDSTSQYLKWARKRVKRGTKKLKGRASK